MRLSAVSSASCASLACAGVVCVVRKNSKRAGLTLGLMMVKKSKKRNPT
ncbi:MULTISPECIES: hypothetical protein [Hymenobacter]|uniref:GlyGly-CTERM sorting domain-containing protein n=1 Tax=Hymenobacter yonginensis TaxID=748197 RepID=A0ABY7PRB9_9BACT|nr:MULTISPECIES: hypothetical protein [Hymenobacter]WBO85396.1 hypothetical protein O9Z63_03940 [Hymenobacter yonginensis]